MVLPNFFIVGGIKCGSTSLYQYLAQHPDIFMCPVKEPSFFSDYGGIQTKYVFSKMKKGFSEQPLYQKPDKKFQNLSKDEYLLLFDEVKDEKIIGEATPHYLMDKSSAEMIHAHCQDAKILISLRDPIERIYSWYLSSTRTKDDVDSFSKKIRHSFKNLEHDSSIDGWTNQYKNILRPSFYFNQVEKYLNVFGRKQVKIITFEEVFLGDIRKGITDILKFLGLGDEIHEFDLVNTDGYFTPNMGVLNILRNPIVSKIGTLVPYKIRIKMYRKLREKDKKKPLMKEEDRKFLRDIFSDDVKKTEMLIGRVFPWKNFHE